MFSRKDPLRHSFQICKNLLAECASGRGSMVGGCMYAAKHQLVSDRLDSATDPNPFPKNIPTDLSCFDQFAPVA